MTLSARAVTKGEGFSAARDGTWRDQAIEFVVCWPAAGKCDLRVEFVMRMIEAIRYSGLSARQCW
jgi:hypothetical protein